MNNLRILGEGAGSINERLKLQSSHLRGRIGEELARASTHFEEQELQLLKFHGTYQQDDRDERKARKAAGEEPAYQFMVRTRIPGGALSAQQYLAHDRIASMYGNGTLRLTTRQGIQLHGVLKGDLRATIAEINQTLLTTLAACGDVNRNVMACPAPSGSPVSQSLQEYAQRVAVHLAPKTGAYHELWIDGEKQEPQFEFEPIYGKTYLPRKFKIAFADTADNCVDIFTQDIGFIAHGANGTIEGFTVVIGGGMGMTHGKSETSPRAATPLCFIEGARVVKLAEAIVTIQRDYGDRTNRKHARMKYVVEERGIAWFRQQIEERTGWTLLPPRAIHCADVCDHLGWHPQADGRWYVGVSVQNGRLKDTESIELRSALRIAIETFAPSIHITGQQNILLGNIPAYARGAVEAIFSRHNVTVNPEHLGVRRYAMACPAAPTCGLALAEAERVLPVILMRIQEDLDELELTDRALSIRMTGCPNGCARPYMGDVGIVGRSKDLYDIFLGGDWANTRLNTQFKTSVQREDITATLRPLFVLWKTQGSDSETFGDFTNRVGFEFLLAAIQSSAAV